MVDDGKVLAHGYKDHDDARRRHRLLRLHAAHLILDGYVGHGGPALGRGRMLPRRQRPLQR